MASVAIVSGAFVDVCADSVMRLAADGMDIAVIEAKSGAGARLASRVAETGRRSMAIETDMTDAACVETVLADVCAALGHPSVLLLGIGLSGGGPPDRLSEGEWSAMTSDPLRGLFLASREVVDPMVHSGGGHIITIGAPAGTGQGRAPENLTLRAALAAFTRTIAMELRPFGITANLIVPAPVLARVSLDGRADPGGGPETGTDFAYAALAAATLPLLVGDTAAALSGQTICLGE